MIFWAARAVPLAQKSAPPKGQISVAEILDRHAVATGGLDAWRALQTLDAHGTFGAPGLHDSGDFDFYYKAPASDVFELDMISHGLSWFGHDSGTVFFKHTAGGIGALNAVTVNVLEANWLGLVESEFSQHYTRIELVGLSSVRGKWAYALRFTPKMGDAHLRYYDCESFLLVQMDLAQRIRLQKDGQEYAYKVETYYSDYRDSGGIKFPRRITATSSGGDVVLEVHKIRTNGIIADSVFQKK
jgi:hypothetical protein